MNLIGIDLNAVNAGAMKIWKAKLWLNIIVVVSVLLIIIPAMTLPLL